MEAENIVQSVRTAINLFNEQLPPRKRLVPDMDCQLVGSRVLDSVDLVNLFVMVEQQVEQDLGVAISLFDGASMGRGVEDLVTVGALVNSLTKAISRG